MWNELPILINRAALGFRPDKPCQAIEFVGNQEPFTIHRYRTVHVLKHQISEIDMVLDVTGHQPDDVPSGHVLRVHQNAKPGDQGGTCPFMIDIWPEAYVERESFVSDGHHHGGHLQCPEN